MQKIFKKIWKNEKNFYNFLRKIFLKKFWKIWFLLGFIEIYKNIFLKLFI